MDYLKIKEVFHQMELSHVVDLLGHEVEAFVKRYYENGEEMIEYLLNSLESVVIRMKNAADHGVLSEMI